MRLLIVFCATLLAVCAKQVSYDGYKVYRLVPKTEQHLAFLHKLSENPHIDFWSSLRSHNRSINVMVDPKAQVMFTWMLKLNRIQHEVLINNVETVVKRERFLQMQASSLKKDKISFTKYNRFNEINNYLVQLQKDYPDLVNVQSIGNSYEGRHLKIIQISKNPNANNPVIFIDAGIHAREWIAPAMAQYIINQLVENPSNGYLLNKVDWHILPVMNPDGYEYSHTNNRFWRKTRSYQGICTGTDGNRNFDFHWGEIGASTDPCYEDYMGPYPFSEVETKNVKIYLENWESRVKLYITFHSYGNYILYPWGYTEDLPEDDAELRSLAEQVNAAIVQAGGDEYEIGTSTNVLYAAAGGSDDWAKGVAGIQLAYTIELPGGGGMGFDPSPSRITPIVRETFHGIKVYGEYIAKKFGR